MSGIRAFLTNRLTWVTALYILAFVVIAHASKPGTMSELVRTFATAMGFVGMAAYGEAAYRAYKAHRWPNPDLIAALGMFTICMGVAFGGVFQVVWRLSQFRTYVVNNDWYSFTVSLIGVGIFILVAVPNLIGQGVPKMTRVRIVSAWVLTTGAIIGLVVFSPDLSWIAEALKPVLYEGPP
jgi:hypothetical protein